VYRWVDEQLKVPQMDLCRNLPRRCHNALVDEIRRHYRKPRQKPEPPEPISAEQILEHQQEMMGVLGIWMRHYSPLTELTSEEKVLVLDSIMAGHQIPNTVFARQLGKSEGYVRKLKARLLTKLRHSKKERREYWERKEARRKRQEAKHWAKLARRDKTAWWETKGGKPSAVNTKK
jgi:hypothetical protein